MTSSRARDVAHRPCRLDEQQRGRLEQRLDPLDERRRVPAVDDAVIEARREVHHLPRHERPARPSTGRICDLVDADDRDLGMVDDRRRDEAAEGAERRDRDGRAATARRGVALPSRAASASRAISAAQSHRVERLGMADDGHDQAARRLRGDADVDGVDDVMHDAVRRRRTRVQVRVFAQRARTIARIRNGSSVSFGRRRRLDRR